MNFKKKLVSSVLAMSVLGMSGVAFAGASGNIAVSSDYLWRGKTQTAHGAAVSGGLDYGHDSGVYLGTWASNVNMGTEIDVYGGFSKEFGPVGVDLGAIAYLYPMAGMDGTAYEVYGGLSASIASATVSYDIDSSNIHVNGGVDYEIMKSVSVGVSGGWDKDGEYIYYGLGLTKTTDSGDYGFMISHTNDDTADGLGMTWDKNPTMVVSYSKGFDF
jgi:uncharacterized protein (TIGR02001 family)